MRDLVPHGRAVARWVALGSAVGILSGAASALFLYLLDLATDFRVHHRALVYALPFAGLVLGTAYSKWGSRTLGGTGLVIDTTHGGGPQLPRRMAPMVLVGTVLTHLFGGSAGREGTAVQMGASLADWVAHTFRVNASARHELLVAGIAGGFGSVFGTPVAGAVFGMEVVVIGGLSYRALVPAFVAAVVGDLVTRGLGAVHTLYPTVGPVPLSWLLVGQWVLFAAAVALTTRAFVALTHTLKTRLVKWIPSLSLRMAVGGTVLVLLWRGVGTDDYLGLGIPMILRAFTDPGLPVEAFALKLLFTAVTLSAGFLGGEVTPLFFVGAALGNVLGRVFGLPLELAAGVGLAATFAAAANTPLALSIMAVELMGAHLFPHVAIVSALAYLFTGHRGIYPAQRIAKWRQDRPLLKHLFALRKQRNGPRPPT